MPRLVDVDERRQEITDAAARLIARAGIGAATMREVAAEAGWTTGSIAHYFADKRELLLHTLQASLGSRRSRPSRASLDDPRCQLRSALIGALPVDEANRRHWMVTVAFCAQAAGDPELAAVQREAYRDFRHDVAQLLQRCTSARPRGFGGASSDAPERIAEQLIAFADGVALQALFDPESWPAERQLEQLDGALARWAESPR